MDWFGGHLSGNGFMGMAGDWRTARPGVPGRAMGCANGMARDRRAPGRKTSMARASLWPSLSLPPDPDRTTRHFSRRVDLEREKNTIVISPHSLHFETEYPFDFSPSNARTNCNARNQIPIPGQRETGSANNTRMSHTNDETRVRRPSGRGATNHPAPISSGLG